MANKSMVPSNRNWRYSIGQKGQLARCVSTEPVAVEIVAQCPGINEPGYMVRHEGSKVQQWVRESELVV